MPPKAKAAGGNRTAFKAAHKTHLSALAADEQSGKAVAVWLYCIGASTLAETQRKFGANPAWRHA